MISEIIAEIRENAENQFFLEKSQYKYFSCDLAFFLKNREKTEKTLLFEISAFFGKILIFSTVNSDASQRFPTSEDFDFFSQSGNLVIKTHEILEKNRDLLQNPHLSIAVFCISSSCEASLALKTSQLQTLRIYPERPLNFYIEKNHSQNFSFFHFSDESFKIKVNRDSGLGSLSVKSCRIVVNISLDDCMREAGGFLKADYSDFWMNSLEIDRKDVNFCKDCVYILMIQEKTEVKGTINVVKDKKFQLLPASTRRKKI